jgi:4-alpha-glucanotransferase
MVIDRLSAAVGVEPSYVDVMGETHRASTGAKMAVLDALGLAAANLDQACASLRSLRHRVLQRQIDPVSVLRRGKAFVVPVFTPLGEETVTWQVTCEDGSQHQGQSPLLPLDDATRAACTRLWQPLAAPLPDEDAAAPQSPRPARGLVLPDTLPDGYHRLTLNPAQGDDNGSEGMLIIAPATAWLPAAMATQGRRIWGVGAQVYSLRSERNWGMGDFADLKTLCALTGRAGGDVVGINPMHALFLPKPEDASPYSPNSRLFLNPLYLSIEDIPEFQGCADAQDRLADPSLAQDLAEARAADHVRYQAVSRVKLAILPILFAAFQALPKGSDRRQAFDRFVEQGGERLHNFAVFQVLQDHYGMAPWPQWDKAHQQADAPAVLAFAQDHADAVTYQLWLQFECDRQLASAAATLRAQGGTLGLYRDLAVGASPDGADTWMDQTSYVLGARFGAPPDALGPLGQDWGLPPFNPQTLAEANYAPFIAMVRANMRHAGALRIDHAMALQHLFWIPPGLTAREGLYITYPLDALVAILALESHRAECLVIGEDLGTVPPEFRLRMAEENILSYRLLYFERYESGLFMRPDTYPALALATPTSHDLATIAGNWQSWDVEMRHHLGIAGPDGNLQADLQERAKDRDVLKAALIDQGLLGDDFPTGQPLDRAALENLITACHRFLARAPSMLMLANLDDLVGEVTQVNVPGTVCEYPNWRRRLSVSLEEMASAPAFSAALAAIAHERP